MVLLQHCSIVLAAIIVASHAPSRKQARMRNKNKRRAKMRLLSFEVFEGARGLSPFKSTGMKQKADEVIESLDNPGPFHLLPNGCLYSVHT